MGERIGLEDDDALAGDDLFGGGVEIDGGGDALPLLLLLLVLSKELDGFGFEG